MQYWFSRVISFLLHPLLMPTYGLLILFTQVQTYFIFSLPEQSRMFIVGMVFINTFVIPGLFLLYLYRKGRISDIQVSKREERFLPLVLTTILFMSTYYLLKNIGLNRIILMMMIAAISAIIVAFIINIWWKISMHMVGLGGLTGVFYALSYIFQTDLSTIISLLLLLAGITGYSRMLLKQHTLGQIMAGFAMGFGLGFLVLLGAYPV